MKRNPSSQQTSIREIVEFRSSSAERLTRPSDGLPFGVFGDLTPRLYASFGLGSSVLDPRAWLAGVRAVTRMLPPFPASNQPAFGLPADFLCAADGHVLACNHGSHADHQGSVEGLLQRASGHLSATDRPRTNDYG